MDDTYRLQSAVGSLCAGLSRSGLPRPTSAEQLLRLLAEYGAAAPRRPKSGLTSRFLKVLGGGSRPPVEAVDKVYEELEALSRVVASLNASESDLKLALDFVAGAEARTRRHGPL